MNDQPSPARSHRGRSALSVIFGVLGVFGVLVSVLAVWAHEVLFDSSSVSSAVEQTLLDPEVTDALAVYLTDQVLEAVPVEQLVEDRLPDQLTGLSPILVGGVRTVVHDGLSRVLADEKTRAVIVTASERAHRAVMRVLDGGRLSDGLTVGDEQVSLNLLPIVSHGFEALQDAGLLTNVDLPDLIPGGNPADQIRQLEDAIGRSLPDGFGQLVVYRSDQIAAAQTAVSRAQQALVLFRRTIFVILAVTAVSLAVSVALAARRRRALVALLLGTVAAMAVGRAIIRTVVQKVPTLAIEPGSRAALRNMVESLASGLFNAVTLALLAGLVLAVVTYLSGSSRTAEAIRGRASSTQSSLGSVVTAHREGTAIAAFTLAVIVIAGFGFSMVPLLVASLLAVGGAAALWVLPAASDEVPRASRP